MKGYKMIVCEICGKTAEVPANRKISYCNNKACEIQAKQKHRDETYRKSNEKIKNKIQELKAKDDGVRTYREDEIIYVKDIVPEANGLVVDVLEFAKKLGQLRYEGDALRKKLTDQQSKLDQQDSDFLHKLESMPKMTVKQAVDLVIENGKSRTDRRDTKTLSVIMNNLINGIMPNPHEYAIKSVKNGVVKDVSYATSTKTITNSVGYFR